ncbi:GDP-mannose 4,6-dehydratase [Gilvimarinus sp. SDUM040013]|uniref:GDP-mannose 4,6-dehydratase n=1 Tax=Gilvimarinus gilvus TaxID=3058038 RepID=A0ABU4RVX8_9GAMM|nr:NAD-dependent epimerase/dehydratase family protein [Gilvimarinus sp. SDUM040013]MDO3387338.1 GDP-mannose 4,6-dehydratase [Gilvimarinus sp. SDUM040013]MDX6849027.1 GDP-mannose 4,6-dehydratase [Gilvimarinus sp. SDUM040013]
MTILVTGSAGFIGADVAEALLSTGAAIVGVDNHNDNYDPALKEGRLKKLLRHDNYSHQRIDIFR